MTKKEFLKGFKEAVKITERTGGEYPLCFAVEQYLSESSLNHFRDNMEKNWWPGGLTISFDLRNEHGFEFARDSILLARLICLCEWKEIVLKTKAYKEF